MKFTDLDRIAPALFLAGQSLELRSSPGRGKSMWTRSQVNRMSKMTGSKWGYASCFLATMTPSDLMGFMVPMKDEQGRVLSQFSLPSWFQTADPETGKLDGKMASDYERGILFLDEFGQGEADVKRASAELLLNGQLGPHKINKSTVDRPGWIVIAASNFVSDRSGVTKDFDFLINRRTLINIDDDTVGWEDWAMDHGVNPILIAFAHQNVNIVFSKGVPDKQGPWCTPRSLVHVGEQLEAIAGVKGGDLPLDPVSMEIAQGTIGAGATAQLFAMIKLGQEMPRYEDIVANPMNAKLPKQPDAQMLVCYRLAANVTTKDVDPIVDYVERLPKEFSVTFAKQAVRRDTSLVNTKRFGKWCTDNSTLMAAIQDVRTATST
jgi:hypothetical protein